MADYENLLAAVTGVGSLFGGISASKSAKAARGAMEAEMVRQKELWQQYGLPMAQMGVRQAKFWEPYSYQLAGWLPQIAGYSYLPGGQGGTTGLPVASDPWAQYRTDLARQVAEYLPGITPEQAAGMTESELLKGMNWGGMKSGVSRQLRWENLRSALEGYRSLPAASTGAEASTLPEFMKVPDWRTPFTTEEEAALRGAGELNIQNALTQKQADVNLLAAQRGFQGAPEVTLQSGLGNWLSKQKALWEESYQKNKMGRGDQFRQEAAQNYWGTLAAAQGQQVQPQQYVSPWLQASQSAAATYGDQASQYGQMAGSAWTGLGNILGWWQQQRANKLPTTGGINPNTNSVSSIGYKYPGFTVSQGWGLP